MKHYLGKRTVAGCEVDVIDKTNSTGRYPLDPRYDLRDHSPTGYEWGYSGSGPAQLSLALVTDSLGDDEQAQQCYQDFKFKIIARIKGDRWEMSEEDIRQAVAQIMADQGRRK